MALRTVDLLDPEVFEGKAFNGRPAGKYVHMHVACPAVSDNAKANTLALTAARADVLLAVAEKAAALGPQSAFMNDLRNMVKAAYALTATVKGDPAPTSKTSKPRRSY